MRNITDTAQVREMMRAKQALEARLAWELLDEFNNPQKGFIGRLRQMVGLSVDVMDVVSGDPEFDRKWNSSWNKYAVCTDNGIREWNPLVIKTASNNFIAQDCADWIRIFGEVIEEIVKGDQDAARKAFQTGAPYHWNKFDPKKGSQLDAGRRRVTEGDKQKGNIGVLTDYYGGADDFRVWGFMSTISPKAGINRWRVMEGDTCGKMDQVFGLMPGATISGTTTDNIYFFNRFQGAGLDPVFYLLPLATIVAPGHHSMLEVGLPLSLNGFGEYRVGLYSTLFPNGVQNDNRPAGVIEIGQILDFAERHPDNHLMVVYYANNQPAGCFLYDSQEDRRKWRSICWGNRFLEVFRSVPAWPNHDQVVLLRRALGIF